MIENQEHGEGWALYNSDCIDVLRDLPDHSIGYSIFSPPFSNLFSYSASPRDMGNCEDYDEFFSHFSYLTKEMARVMKPCRDVSIHCMMIPKFKFKNGIIGRYDFRGDLIRAFEKEGFIYHSEVTIRKNPVVAMQRTKAVQLLYKTVLGNSAMSGQVLSEYLVTMRSPGDPDDMVTHERSEYPLEYWQKIADNVWTDINPGDTLQYKSARESEDQSHICPLQLEVIRRGILLWSNPGDVVLSPYAGIGSEGYVALELGRKFVGAELKMSYYRQAIINISSRVKQESLKLG